MSKLWMISVQVSTQRPLEIACLKPYWKKDAVAKFMIDILAINNANLKHEFQCRWVKKETGTYVRSNVRRSILLCEPFSVRSVTGTVFFNTLFILMSAFCLATRWHWEWHRPLEQRRRRLQSASAATAGSQADSSTSGVPAPADQTSASQSGKPEVGM